MTKALVLLLSSLGPHVLPVGLVEHVVVFERGRVLAQRVFLRQRTRICLRRLLLLQGRLQLPIELVVVLDLLPVDDHVCEHLAVFEHGLVGDCSLLLLLPLRLLPAKVVLRVIASANFFPRGQA